MKRPYKNLRHTLKRSIVLSLKSADQNAATARRIAGSLFSRHPLKWIALKKRTLIQRYFRQQNIKKNPEIPITRYLLGALLLSFISCKNDPPPPPPVPPAQPVILIFFQETLSIKLSKKSSAPALEETCSCVLTGPVDLSTSETCPCLSELDKTAQLKGILRDFRTQFQKAMKANDTKGMKTATEQVNKKIAELLKEKKREELINPAPPSQPPPPYDCFCLYIGPPDLTGIPRCPCSVGTRNFKALLDIRLEMEKKFLEAAERDDSEGMRLAEEEAEKKLDELFRREREERNAD